MLIRFLVVSTLISTALFAQTAYSPFTGAERARWLVQQNLSPKALALDVVSGANSTWSNSPEEYGPHWDGFARRVGLTAANSGTRTVMEAGLGSMWGEDPRYSRTEGESFRGRLGHVVKMTFFARNRAGDEVPAYARFLAVPGSSFLANTWMPDSKATVSEAAVRSGLSFLGRMGSNAVKEFWPRR